MSNHKGNLEKDIKALARAMVHHRDIPRSGGGMNLVICVVLQSGGKGIDIFV